MPYNSAQISGLVGGQMAMFANQATFSQQVGGMAGVGPMPMGGPMQNPFPNAGPQVAGAMGMALPGMATGAAIGGALARGTLGWLDPVTGIARGFASGAGMAGQGFGQVAGGLGNAFMTGGLRAGAGMMAGGLAGAAAMAPPYALAGGAIQTVGENIYAGAQNVADIGNLSQHFGAQWGTPGARGGAMGRQTIKNIVGVLHDLVGDDVRNTMDDLKRLMDQAGQMGMLAGINNAQEFRNRFTKIVRQVRDITDVMGTSMAEAAPMFAQMRQMGLWTAQDVMGTAMAARVAGPAAGQLMATMGQGAQMSHAMGGTMRQGAMMGRESFMNLGAAVRAGVLSQQDVMEFTGGVGGAAGQQAMAQRMTGIMGAFGQTAAGRLLMAGLGQTEGGVFTGGINQGRLQQFLSGELSVNQLQAMGQRSARTREGAMSFYRQEGRLGQQLGAQGGMEAIAQIVQQVADTRFKGSEQARHQLFRQMLGVSNREAELLGRIADELPRIQDQRTREMEANIARTFQDLERRQYRSWEGFSNAARGMMTQATRPIQELGEDLATGIGDVVDRATQALTGRVQQIPMTMTERSRLLRGGALTADITGFGTEAFNIGGDALPNIIRRMQAPGSAGRAAAGFGIGAAAGVMLGPMGLGAGQIAGAAAPMLGFGEDMTPQQRAFQTLGITAQMTRTQAQTALRRANMRAMTPTAEGLGLDDPRGEKLAKVKSALDSVIGQHSKELSDLKKEDPGAYTDRMIELLGEKDPDLRNWGAGTIRDYLAVAQKEYNKGDLAVDFRGDVLRAGNIATTPEGLARQQRELVTKLASGQESIATKGERIGKLGIAGILGVGITGGMSMFLPLLGLGPGGRARETVERALTGPGSDVFAEYMKGNITKEDAQRMLSRIEGGDVARSMVENLQGEDLAQAREKFATWERSRMAQIQPEALARIQTMAGRGPQEMAGISGFGAAVSAYRRGDITAGVAEVEAIAGRISGREAGRLGLEGGAVGRQIAALHRAQRLGTSLTEEQTQELRVDLRRLGFDIDKMGGDELKRMLEKGVTAEEMEGEEGVASRVAEVVKTHMSETRGARGTANQQMMQLLNLYTDKNTQFVNAVNHALGGEGDVGESARALSGAKEDASAATPPWYQRLWGAVAG